MSNFVKFKNYDGRKVYIARDNIAEIAETGEKSLAVYTKVPLECWNFTFISVESREEQIKEVIYGE